MNTFKRKSLYAALACVSALGVAGAAQAVNVNPDGLGQVLIYPYYTVRSDTNTGSIATNQFQTLLSVVNTTASAKAVKVRFLEGKNSKEVLDFNLFLSKNDVWTAAVTQTAGGAKIILGPGVPGTPDKSCTVPTIDPVNGVDFRNILYQGDGNDGSLDRTREGYFEIIEMGTVAGGTTLETQVTHVNGVPPGCAALQTTSTATITGQLVAPTGGLMGSASLVNVVQGADYTEDPTVLDAFSNAVNYTDPGLLTPDLSFVSPKTSVVFNGSAGTVQTDWSTNSLLPGGAADPVSAVLMHDNVLNEFSVDPAINSETDWVITMPTKRNYVNVGTGAAPRLFQSNFAPTIGSCDQVSLSLFDREEQTSSTPLQFSPQPTQGPSTLCWEANVLTFTGAKVPFANISHVFGSKNVQNIDLTNAGTPYVFQNGWLRLGFTTGSAHVLVGGSTIRVTPAGVVTTALGATYLGLPTIGFAVEEFSNNTLTVGTSTVLSNYGGNWQHKFTRNIQ